MSVAKGEMMMTTNEKITKLKTRLDLHYSRRGIPMLMGSPVDFWRAYYDMKDELHDLICQGIIERIDALKQSLEVEKKNHATRQAARHPELGYRVERLA